MKELYDNQDHVDTTFDEDNFSEYILQARWAEMVELKKAFSEIYARQNSNLRVLDIGIGGGRIPKHLSGIDEIWGTIRSYEGIDIAQNRIDLSSKLIQDRGLQDKVSVRLLDAVNMDQLSGFYDAIISTWFTVDNFYPDDFSFDDFTPGAYDLTHNNNFETIFRKSYAKLKEGGEIIIGSMYLDNESTRKKQEASYKKFGWTVITDEKDCFTASKDGWWSQRFTKQRIYDYLCFVPKDQISFTHLDTYDYAMMVRIKK